MLDVAGDDLEKVVGRPGDRVAFDDFGVGAHPLLEFVQRSLVVLRQADARKHHQPETELPGIEQGDFLRSATRFPAAATVS